MPLDRESPIKRTKIAKMGIAKLREEGKAYKLTPETARAAVETRWRNARLRKQKELEDAMIAANARKP